MTPDLAVGRRFLVAQGAPGAFLVGVTGAHYYGFPSPDSDLDLKGIHVAPTREVVSLQPPPDSFDHLGVFEGVEIDYTSHELGMALRLLLKGNGNILERILSPLQVLQEIEFTLDLELEVVAAVAQRGGVLDHLPEARFGLFGKLPPGSAAQDLTQPPASQPFGARRCLAAVLPSLPRLLRSHA